MQMGTVNRIDPWQRVYRADTDAPLNQIGIQRILVPVDFSVCTAETLCYASAFAKQFGATIHLLHVVQLNIAGEERGIPRTGLIRQMGDAARSALQKLVQVLWDGEIPAMITIREGRPSEVILREARDSNADLIVIGTSNRSWLSRVLRRNTVVRMVREAPCPVLVIRTGTFQNSAPSNRGTELAVSSLAT